MQLLIVAGISVLSGFALVTANFQSSPPTTEGRSSKVAAVAPVVAMRSDSDADLEAVNKSTPMTDERNGSALMSERLETETKCESVLSFETIQQIQSYQEVVHRIVNHTTEHEKGETWRQLADFVDRHGPRFTGTASLEKAIDDRKTYLATITGANNVHTEFVEIPVWNRGETEVVLLNAWDGQRNKTLNVLTLGYSVGTPTKEGFVADALVVRSFEELASRTDVKRKIVVFNQNYTGYSSTVTYRSKAASRVASDGGVAALIRSVTPYSLYTPHTGMMSYDSDVKKVPAISITVEDAELMWRKQQRGEKLQIFIRSTAHETGTTHSRNTIADVTGTTHPQEIVLVSGHIDSWDVGQGAMDDGGGAAISWRVPEVLKSLGLRPRRTVRTVLFTSEEMGVLGGKAYFQAHKHSAKSVQIVMESDIGVFTPLGLSSGIKNQQAVCIIKEVLKLLSCINATSFDPEGDGPDIEDWFKLGVPGGSLYNANEDYFRYHHTDADMMNVMDPSAMDKATALWTSLAYVFADIGIRIPHDSPH